MILCLFGGCPEQQVSFPVYCLRNDLSLSVFAASSGPPNRQSATGHPIWAWVEFWGRVKVKCLLYSNCWPLLYKDCKGRFYSKYLSITWFILLTCVCYCGAQSVSVNMILFSLFLVLKGLIRDDLTSTHIFYSELDTVLMVLLVRLRPMTPTSRCVQCLALSPFDFLFIWLTVTP